MASGVYIFSLVVSSFAAIAAIVKYYRSENKAKAEAAAREAWTLEQISRWRRGDLVAIQEPSISGGSDVLVIEPEPGHRIVVGTVGHGKFDRVPDCADIEPFRFDGADAASARALGEFVDWATRNVDFLEKGRMVGYEFAVSSKVKDAIALATLAVAHDSGQRVNANLGDFER